MDRTHALVIASGRVAAIHLYAFLQLCQTAAAVQRAFEAAMETGPVEKGQRGEAKAGSAWRVWLQTSALYAGWLDRFGLTPRARVGLPQLPPIGGGLRTIEGGKYVE